MARLTDADRTRRIIAILGQLTPNARIPLATLASELGASEADLARDLEVLCVCGVAPYFPDDYLPVFVEDGYVEVLGQLPALDGPVRLSPTEARALAAALEAAGFGAGDELVSRLLSAAATPAFDAEDLARVIRTATTAHEHEVYEALAQAVSKQTVVRIEYVRGATDSAVSREVEPVALFAERGAWYLTAWCRLAGSWRTFRLDRIRSAGLTGESFDAHARTGVRLSASAFAPEGLPLATLEFAPDEQFSERDWPGGHVVAEAEDGTVTAEVPYGGTGWIARRVVARLGRVRVTAPDEVREAVAELAGVLAVEAAG